MYVFYWRYLIGLIILSGEILDKWRKDAVVLMKKERRKFLMSILFNEQAGIFKLDALDTSYIIGIFDEDKFVSHLS